MSDQQTFEIDREDFGEWLRLKTSEAGVGVTNRVTACPLSCYLTCRDGKAYAVSYDTIRELPRGDFLALPRWAAAFTRQIDDAVGPFKPVSAEVAQRVLFDIPREEG